MRDMDTWHTALKGLDAVYHLAAEVGVGTGNAGLGLDVVGGHGDPGHVVVRRSPGAAYDLSP